MDNLNCPRFEALVATAWGPVGDLEVWFSECESGAALPTELATPPHIQWLHNHSHMHTLRFYVLRKVPCQITEYVKGRYVTLTHYLESRRWSYRIVHPSTRKDNLAESLPITRRARRRRTNKSYLQPADATDGTEEGFDDEEGEQTRRDGAQATHAYLHTGCAHDALRFANPSVISDRKDLDGT